MFNALGNGTGGINWDGLDVWVARFGIDDVEALMDKLVLIRLHEPPKPIEE